MSRATLEEVRAELGPPEMQFTFEDLQRMRGGLVYLWAREDDVLYVGMSADGLARPLARNHHRLREFQPGDTLLVWRSADSFTLETGSRHGIGHQEKEHVI